MKEARKASGDCRVLALKSLLKDGLCWKPGRYAIFPTESVGGTEQVFGPFDEGTLQVLPGGFARNAVGQVRTQEPGDLPVMRMLPSDSCRNPSESVRTAFLVAA